MTYYLVIWIGLNCPGGILEGFIPAAARPFVCAQEVQQMGFAGGSGFSYARDFIRSAGPGAKARLFVCTGMRTREIKIAWKTELKIEGENHVE